MARRRRTAFNRCVGRKLKGRKFRTRTAQKSAFKAAVRSCARRY